MKLSAQLKFLLEKEIRKRLPPLPKDVDVSESKLKITALLVILEDTLFVEVESNEG